MSFFDQVYQKLFSKENVSEEVLIFETIKRSINYKDAYANWKSERQYEPISERIFNAYLMKQKAVIGELEVYILNSSRSNGLAIQYDNHFGQKEFQFYFDFLAEKVNKLNYKRANSDITVTNKKDKVESVEKHYLKPKSTLLNEPLEQYYGNILIELISSNDQPEMLRIKANTYSDRSYKNALSFHNLAEYLFTD